MYRFVCGRFDGGLQPGLGARRHLRRLSARKRTQDQHDDKHDGNTNRGRQQERPW
jgi:hypothetical protein